MNRVSTPAARAKTTTYWVLQPDQIRCLASTTRQDMVDRLAASGPLSVRELAAAIGKKPSALYHHLDQLLDAELVEEVGTRIVNRRQEKLYATPSPRMRLLRALQDPSLRDLLKETVSALCRQSDRDFAEGMQSAHAETDGPGRNLGFFRLLGAPGPKTLARINRHLNEIAELLWREHRPDAPLLAFAWTLAPLGSPDTEDRPEPNAKKGRS